MARLFLILALLWAPVAQAQQARDFGEMLRSVHLDPAFRQNLRERGYTGDKFEVMVDHTRRLYADRAIIDGLLRRIETGLRLSGNRANGAFFQNLDAALAQAYAIGLTRLSNAERRRLFTTDVAYVNALPTRDCTRLVTGRMPEARGAELFDAFMVQLSAQQLADYHRVLRKATRLGLGRGVTPRGLTGAETRRVEEALFPQIDRMIAAQPNARTLYRAWEQGPRGTRRHMCTFNKMFASSALALKGSTGDLAILYLMAQ